MYRSVGGWQRDFMGTVFETRGPGIGFGLNEQAVSCRQYHPYVLTLKMTIMKKYLLRAIFDDAYTMYIFHDSAPEL